MIWRLCQRLFFNLSYAELTLNTCVNRFLSNSAELSWNCAAAIHILSFAVS